MSSVIQFNQLYIHIKWMEEMQDIKQEPAREKQTSQPDEYPKDENRGMGKSVRQ